MNNLENDKWNEWEKMRTIGIVRINEVPLFIIAEMSHEALFRNIIQIWMLLVSPSLSNCNALSSNI